MHVTQMVPRNLNLFPSSTRASLIETVVTIFVFLKPAASWFRSRLLTHQDCLCPPDMNSVTSGTADIMNCRGLRMQPWGAPTFNNKVEEGLQSIFGKVQHPIALLYPISHC